MNVRVGLLEPLGWYVAAPASSGLGYLHTDGTWRSSAAHTVKGKTLYSGYFPSEEIATKAAARAGCTALLPATQCASNAMANAVMKAGLYNA